MAHPFPQETVELIKESIKGIKKPFDFFFNYIHLISTSGIKFYGFEDQLRSGEYATYEHEMKEKGISTYNCTTIIPTAYLYAEFLGLKPRIMQFEGMADYAIETDETPKMQEDASHYALFIEHQGQTHLCDPFWDIFAPVSKMELNCGSNGQVILCEPDYGYIRTRKRIFKKWKPCPAEEFAAMMSRLKEPAESLDMLVSGQNYCNLDLASSLCRLNVYYNDEKNTITTRLYIPQPGLSDKAVICNQKLNDEGESKSVNFEFYLAEKCTWTRLIGGKRIAKTNSRLLQAGIDEKNELQIVMELLLDKVLGQLWDNYSSKEIESIKPQILARSLYLAALQNKDYLYPLEEQDRFLIQKMKEVQELKKQELHCDLEIILHSSGLEKITEEAAEDIRKKRDHIKIAQEKSELLAAELRLLRRDHLELYRKNRDLVLFAQKELAGLSAEQLEARARKKRLNEITGTGINWTFGYSEMLLDFLHYLTPEVMSKLLLKEYMSSIREKVKARRLKYHSK